MIRYLLLTSFLLIHIAWAQPLPKPPTSQPWKTLDGQRPVVIARGGLSGVFPESSDVAYSMAKAISLKDTVLFCDLQLTKDSKGFCLSEIRLENATIIGLLYPERKQTYNINGQDVTGWFALDFMSTELFPNATLIQSILTRSDLFDNLSPLVLFEDFVSANPGGVWLNVEYDTFYNQHKLSPATFIENYRHLNAIYISSPEIGFMKAINPKVDKKKTKLIFRFLHSDAIEPTTKQPYSAILKNLAAIKEFASGILVPKDYIVPVGKDKYLQQPTRLVIDAHNLGLEVHASGFANDVPTSYNYSYDPTLEYLQFVDNLQFSVDGVLTDFAGTASEAIACIAHNKNATRPQQGKVLIISHNGASGDYAACTDLAYEKAVNDGADIIDCSVQMSKDGVAFCSDDADLTRSTNAIATFMSQSTTVPEVQNQPGIFSFDLTWKDIQTLKPKLTGLVPQGLPRNPAFSDKGKFMTLADFLEFAKKKGVSGILINIENAAYLASKRSLDIIKAINTALKNAALDKQSTQKIFIQSEDSSVLALFKDFPSYRKVYAVTKEITTIQKPALEKIKKFADTVDLSKNTLITLNGFFTSNNTRLVKQMHDANISVHVSILYNEFTTIPFDMFSDPMINLATFITGLRVDGVVTEYPATARNYLRSPCIDEKAEYQIHPVEIGSLLGLAGTEALAPVAAPTALELTDVVEPPIPPATKPSPPSPPANHHRSPSTQLSVASLTMCIMSILVFSLLCATH